MSTQVVEHPLSRARVGVPADWEVLDGRAGDGSTTPSDALVALEPAPQGTDLFRANLVLTVVDNATTTFRDWQTTTDELLPRMLSDYLLLDLEKLEVAGLPGGRRLAHHVSPDGVAVTMEQWFTQVGSTGVTLTATIDSGRYDLWAEDLAGFASTLDLSDLEAAR